MNADSIHYNSIHLPEYGEGLGKFSDNCFLSWFSFWSVVLGILAIGIAILLLDLVNKKPKWFEALVNNHLSKVFAFVWFYAFVVYSIGMYTGETCSLVGNVPMVMLYAFSTFLFQSDISAIHPPFYNNGWFMAAFSTAHFLAALTSLAFVLKHFGFNIMAAFRRQFTFSVKQDTYIFWGLNDASYFLAKDILRQETVAADARIIVIRTSYDNDTAETKNLMDRLLTFLSMKNKDLERLKELNCITTTINAKLSEIANAGSPQQPADILKKELGLKSIARFISKKTTRSVHLFFLTDQEEENIQAVANLRYDKSIVDFARQGHVKLYCHARYNSIHRVIEDEMTDEHIEVKVVDSSHICVEGMKRNPLLHPVNYVKIENDATVSTPFNALVIGFGEVGVDSVRFLYEYGAFIKTGAGANVRSDFCCHVVDENMNALAGVFTVNAPSIAVAINNQDDKQAKMVNLYEMDCRSIEFYNRLKAWIKTLNYVVIATSDDETNISLAIRIFRLAIRERYKDAGKMSIMVRIRHDENGHFYKLAQHYNRLWAADKASTQKDHLQQDTVKAFSTIDGPIALFGSAQQVYTYDNVVNESLKTFAKKFKEKYDLSINELRKAAGKEPYDFDSWDDEQNKLMQLTGPNKGFSPTFSGIMKLRRVQTQNMANSLHKDTKEMLARTALGQECFERMLLHGLVRKDGELTYTWKDRANLPLSNIQRVLTVLAQTEHLRWNASHEILGYQEDAAEQSKDEARLLHGCLKPWDQLSKPTQSYDYNIVDVSLGLTER